MSIVRWDPFHELESINDRLDRIFGRSHAQLSSARNEALRVTDWAPAVDISESETEFIVKAELPEVGKDDVKVRVEHGVLSIEGERKSEKEEKGKRFHRIERQYGSFTRAFTLPDNVDEAKVSAAFKDGILKVTVPKGEKPKPKSVDIKVS